MRCNKLLDGRLQLFTLIFSSHVISICSSDHPASSTLSSLVLSWHHLLNLSATPVNTTEALPCLWTHQHQRAFELKQVFTVFTAYKLEARCPARLCIYNFCVKSWMLAVCLSNPVGPSPGAKTAGIQAWTLTLTLLSSHLSTTSSRIYLSWHIYTFMRT